MSTEPYAARTSSSAASNLLVTVAPVVGRAMISTIFLLSGLSKIAAPAMTIGYILVRKRRATAGTGFEPVQFEMGYSG